MKRNTYQKLLMSLALVAFFGTLTSARVLSRNQVDVKQIQTQEQTMTELKKKAKAQGLTAIPKEWLDEAKQQRDEANKQARTRKAVNPKPTLKKVKKSTVERKTLAKKNLSIYEIAKQITPPRGYEVGIHTVGSKQYIEFLELPDQGAMTPAKAKN